MATVSSPLRSLDHGSPCTPSGAALGPNTVAEAVGAWEQAVGADGDIHEPFHIFFRSLEGLPRKPLGALKRGPLKGVEGTEFQGVQISLK